MKDKTQDMDISLPSMKENVAPLASGSTFVVTGIIGLFISSSDLSHSSMGTTIPGQLTGPGGGGGSGYVYVYGGLHGEWESTGIYAGLGPGWFYNSISYSYGNSEVVGTTAQWSISSGYAGGLAGPSVSVFTNSPYTVTTSGSFSSSFNPSFQLATFFGGQTGNFYSNVIGDSSGHINGAYQYNGQTEYNVELVDLIFSFLD